MRLIDADALLEYLDLMYDTQYDWTDSYNTGVLGAIYYIKHKAPTIDAVSVVRCKECKWRREDNSCDLNCRIDYLDGTETDMWFYVNDDDFCSYGERKESER